MKRIFAFILSVIMIFGIFSTTQAKKNPPVVIKMTVNGINCSFDQMPVMLNDRVIVPMRGMFEMLGATVTWDPLKSEVTGELDGVKVKLKIGIYEAYVNDKKYTLDVPSQIVNGRTLIPARFVAEAFGATVNWNQETRTVEISGIGEKSKVTAAAEKMFARVESSKLILDEQMIFGHGNVKGSDFGTIKVKTLDDLFYGTALEVNVTKKPENSTDMGYVYKNFPEIGELDNLCVKIVFRAAKCDYEIGYGKMAVSLISSQDKVVHREELKAGSSWTSYYIPVASFGDVKRMELDFGYDKQIIEVSQIKVLNFKQIPLDILPDNVTDYR